MDVVHSGRNGMGHSIPAGMGYFIPAGMERIDSIPLQGTNYMCMNNYVINEWPFTILNHHTLISAKLVHFRTTTQHACRHTLRL